MANRAETIVGTDVIKGFQQITSLNASIGLTVPDGVRYAIIECDHTAGQYVRWRDDGTAPSATVGMTIPPGAQLIYNASDLKQIRFIEEAAGAKLNIAYYGG